MEWQKADILYLRFGLAGLSCVSAAETLGILPRTLRRYEREHSAPTPVVLALRALAGFGPPWSAWQDWRFDAAGMLVSPEGATFEPGEVRAIPYDRALIAELQRELRHITEPGFQNVLPLAAAK